MPLPPLFAEQVMKTDLENHSTDNDEPIHLSSSFSVRLPLFDSFSFANNEDGTDRCDDGAAAAADDGKSFCPRPFFDWVIGRQRRRAPCHPC